MLEQHLIMENEPDTSVLTCFFSFGELFIQILLPRLFFKVVKNLLKLCTPCFHIEILSPGYPLICLVIVIAGKKEIDVSSLSLKF